LAAASRTIRALKRRRRGRLTKLRAASAEDEDAPENSTSTGTRVCPVCQQDVPGDTDVIEAHIDACLAHMAMQASGESVEVAIDIYDDDDGWTEITDESGDRRLVRTGAASVRGAGFAVLSHVDVEDEIDVDGDDEALFGVPQFSESDVLRAESQTGGNDDCILDVSQEDRQGIEGREGEEDGAALRALVAEGKIARRHTPITEMHYIERSPTKEADSTDATIASACGALGSGERLHALEAQVRSLVRGVRRRSRRSGVISITQIF
jgi:hypothetical protein